MRHATSSAFKGVKVGQVAKSRCYSSEPHDPSAGWAMWRCWRAFIGEFVGHGQRSLEPQCPRHPTPCPSSIKSGRSKLAILRQRFVAMRRCILAKMRRSGSREPHVPHLRLLRGSMSAPLVSGVMAADRGIDYESRAVCGQREARPAVLLSITGVTAIMLIANLFLTILR